MCINTRVCPTISYGIDSVTLWTHLGRTSKCVKSNTEHRWETFWKIWLPVVSQSNPTVFSFAVLYYQQYEIHCSTNLFWELYNAYSKHPNGLQLQRTLLFKYMAAFYLGLVKNQNTQSGFFWREHSIHMRHNPRFHTWKDTFKTSNDGRRACQSEPMCHSLVLKGCAGQELLMYSITSGRSWIEKNRSVWLQEGIWKGRSYSNDGWQRPMIKEKSRARNQWSGQVVVGKRKETKCSEVQ